MSGPLARFFARRMAPLAIIAGVVVALIPPLSYRLVAWRQLEAQASLYATQMAAAVGRAIEEEPYLLRYSAPKIVGAVAGYRGQRDLSRVSVLDCGGAPFVSSVELGLGTGAAAGPSARAPIGFGTAALGQIEVAMDTSAQRRVLAGLAGAAIFLGAALALLLFFFPTRVVRAQERRLQRTLEQLAATEGGLRRSNLELAGRVNQAVGEMRALSQRLLTLQEEERQRIARELHDGVGQATTALQIALRLAEREPAEAATHLGAARRLAEEVLSEIRAAVFALRPAGLGAEGGLETALRDCVERFELQSRTPASFRCEGSLTEVPEAVAIGLLRILQEALTNVSRHAGASEVGVLIEASDRAIRLEVADDGRGLPQDPASRGFGLRGMIERTGFFGGTLELRSREGEGTTIAVELPLPGGKHDG
jgi:signal transduction histidine kinase